MQESYGADLAPKFDNSQLIGYHLYIQKVWVCVCTPTLKPWVILPPQINWLSTVQYPTYHVRHGLLGSNRGRHRPTAEPSSWASSLRTITKQIYKEQSLSRRKSGRRDEIKLRFQITQMSQLPDEDMRARTISRAVHTSDLMDLNKHRNRTCTDVNTAYIRVQWLRSKGGGALYII